MLRASHQLSSKKNVNHSVLFKPPPLTLLNLTLYCMVASSSESLVKVAQMVICIQCRRLKFDPWVQKILCRRAWQPTPVFLPWRFPGTEEPGGLQSMGSQTVGTTERLNNNSLTFSLDSFSSEICPSGLSPGVFCCEDSICCCCSIAQLCPTLRDSTVCSTLGSPVLTCHHLPEFAQTHIH